MVDFLLKLIFLIITLTLFACNGNKEERTVNYPTLSNSEQDELIDKAIFTNNDTAYIEICNYYGIYNNLEEFLPIAMRMANKNNSGRACLDVYWILIGREIDDNQVVDNKTKSLAFYYLLRSYELGFSSARFSIDKEFGEDSIPPNSSYFLYEMAKD